MHASVFVQVPLLYVTCTIYVLVCLHVKMMKKANNMWRRLSACVYIYQGNEQF